MTEGTGNLDPFSQPLQYLQYVWEVCQSVQPSLGTSALCLSRKVHGADDIHQGPHRQREAKQRSRRP